MMEITIKLFATLRNGRFAVETGEYPEGTTVGQVIQALDIPGDQAAIIFVNNRHAATDRPLSHGDVVAFFPPIGGG